MDKSKKIALLILTIVFIIGCIHLFYSKKSSKESLVTPNTTHSNNSLTSLQTQSDKISQYNLFEEIAAFMTKQANYVMNNQ